MKEKKMSFYADLIIKVYLVLVNVRGAMAKKKKQPIHIPFDTLCSVCSFGKCYAN